MRRLGEFRQHSHGVRRARSKRCAVPLLKKTEEEGTYWHSHAGRHLCANLVSLRLMKRKDKIQASHPDLLGLSCSHGRPWWSTAILKKTCLSSSLPSYARCFLFLSFSPSTLRVDTSRRPVFRFRLPLCPSDLCSRGRSQRLQLLGTGNDSTRRALSGPTTAHRPLSEFLKADRARPTKELQGRDGLLVPSSRPNIEAPTRAPGHWSFPCRARRCQQLEHGLTHPGRRRAAEKSAPVPF